MTKRQAAKLRPGVRVRRKGTTDSETFVMERVEHVEHPTHVDKNELIVHADGHAFMSWEIERDGPRSGWPKARGAT